MTLLTINKYKNYWLGIRYKFYKEHVTVTIWWDSSHSLSLTKLNILRSIIVFISISSITHSLGKAHTQEHPSNISLPKDLY